MRRYPAPAFAVSFFRLLAGPPPAKFPANLTQKYSLASPKGPISSGFWHRLRKALNRGRESDPIRTVRGSGYSLDERYLKVA